MRVVGILLCAGTSQRMGFDKLTAPLCGRSAVERSMDALVRGGADALVCAVSAATRAFVEALPCPVPRRVVPGGDARQASVRAALEVAAEWAGGEPSIALIHDAARCLVTPALVRACAESAASFGSGVAAVPIADTVLRQGEGAAAVVPRDALWRMQTPQAFLLADILAAYRAADAPATDDMTLFLRAGHTPRLVPGSEDNFKLTTPEDWARARRFLSRYGTGFDTHRLVEGRRLVLGGVKIPFERGLLGHSDADALLHAIMDALLGAAALPDIGHLFPDTDPAYRGADSLALLRTVVARLAQERLRPQTIDATIIAQRPKLAPHLPAMRRNIAAACGIDPACVGLKATTTEGMNDEGRGLCISAQAIASLA